MHHEPLVAAAAPGVQAPVFILQVHIWHLAGSGVHTTGLALFMHIGMFILHKVPSGAQYCIGQS